MRTYARFGLRILGFATVGFLLLPSLAASAQTGSGSSTSGVDLRRLKEEIRRELFDSMKDELKDEIKSELQSEGGVGGVKEDSWAEEEWKWEEPVRPELNFIEVDGFFRFRYQMFKDLDLGLFYTDSTVGPSGAFAGGTAPNVPVCNVDPRCSAGREPGSTLGGANKKLRLEPVFNVYEDIKIKMQIDILDNLVLGSTPEGFPKSLNIPLVAFSNTQNPPSDGINALADSVRVRRAWAEVMTPLGQIRMGRMPSQFGMGIIANEGRGLDTDYGDSADRLMFITKVAGHYIVPAFDWAASGPTSATRLLGTQGQPFDRDQRDDVDQYILAVAKSNTDQEIKEKLENDDIVLNYGTYLVHRTQAFDAADFYANGSPNAGAETASLVQRDAYAWITSLWIKFIWRKLTIEAEGVGIFGEVGNSAFSGNFDTRDIAFTIQQFGGALNVQYKLLQDSLTLGLMTVAASGDSDPGWGVRLLGNATTARGDWDGPQQFQDGKITNFRFDPDFRVDLILWRELIGTVTDALVFRPSVQYNLTEGLGARLDLIYSRALTPESTPSDGLAAEAALMRTADANLGIEADLKLFYVSDDGFHAWFEYGILFPLAGLDRLSPNVDLPLADRVMSAGIAQTLRLMLGVTF